MLLGESPPAFCAAGLLTEAARLCPGADPQTPSGKEGEELGGGAAPPSFAGQFEAA